MKEEGGFLGEERKSATSSGGPVWGPGTPFVGRRTHFYLGGRKEKEGKFEGEKERNPFLPTIELP